MRYMWFRGKPEDYSIHYYDNGEWLDPGVICARLNNGNSNYIGITLYGYCDGFFGRDYGDKTIVYVGDDWCVVRLEDDTLAFTQFLPGWQLEQMHDLLKKWSEW